MIDGQPGYRARLVACLLGAAILLASAGGAEASEAAAQTVRMTVTEASVFDVPTASLTLATPEGSNGSGARAEASIVYRYTILESSDESRILTASWREDDRAPAGCRLRFETGPMASLSSTQTESITVSPVARRVLAISGSSSTGAASTGGAILKYTLEVVGRAVTKPGEHQAATVTLTLVDPS